MALPIEAVHAREVLDSRGRPTVEAEITVAGGWKGLASVPSGASTGKHEALELRDGDPKRHKGLGVLRAVANVNTFIGPELIGCDAQDQREIDAKLIALDGTEDKSRLGANAILAVSLAVARAAANAKRIPLWRHLGGNKARVMPLPMINIISGGLHASRNLDFQDFLIVAVGAERYSQTLEMSLAIYRSTQELLAE